MKKHNQLVIIGDGEFAEIAYEYFTHDSPYKVFAFSVEKDFIQKDNLYNLPIVPFETLESHYNPDEYHVFVAITFTKLNRVRTRFYKESKAKGYKVASYISSHAFVWKNVICGENVFIFENNVVQHHAKIGNNVILWSGNHVGHRTVIKDNCFISSHVVISGLCDIGENCFFGVNSTVGDTVKVGKDCLIGASAVITKNTKENQIYKGNPAVPSKISAKKYYKIND